MRFPSPIYIGEEAEIQHTQRDEILSLVEIAELDCYKFNVKHDLPCSLFEERAYYSS